MGPMGSAICARVPPRHSHRALIQSAFSGARNWKTPLTPSPMPVRTLARLFRQLPASGCPPFIVELFAAGFYRPVAEEVSSPVVVVTDHKLPTLAHVNRTFDSCSRLPIYAGYGPVPVGGFVLILENAPSLMHAASP